MPYTLAESGSFQGTNHARREVNWNYRVNRSLDAGRYEGLPRGLMRDVSARSTPNHFLEELGIRHDFLHRSCTERCRQFAHACSLVNEHSLAPLFGYATRPAGQFPHSTDSI